MDDVQSAPGAIARPHFYDSINPGFISQGALAACYGFGPFAANLRELTRFSGHILINDVPGHPEAARTCRVLDVETGAARPGDILPWLEARKHYGYDNATIYASLSVIPEVLRALDGHPVPRLWIAWWVTEPLTAPAIAQALHAQHGVTVDPAHIWAHQYASGKRIDSSVLLGHDDFTR